MRRVLVSGASGGLGIEISRSLLNDGFFVIMLCNKNKSKLDSLTRKFSNQTKVVEVDFLNDVDYDTLKEEIGAVDSVINCVGISSSQISWKINKEQWDKVFDLNLNTPFRLAQLFIPEMRKNKFGRIVFFSSIVAQKGVVGTSAYSASKSALLGLTRTMASELATSGVTVNCISPGYMDKGMISEVSDQFLSDILESIPAKTLGNSENITHSVSFLLNEKADYITGQVINVNGGMS
ncbi:SDR family oxidoreductase [Crocinitomicaceae bacterium]|jgi:NAD(P)-dependent dehydrogenase (short-subunit alcohol dehydrogenase family)|nr:SDR family oxidoreductase [Crocinitomicaceae bacterium]